MVDEKNDLQDVEEENPKGGEKSEFAKLYEESISQVKAGQIVKGALTPALTLATFLFNPAAITDAGSWDAKS